MNTRGRSWPHPFSPWAYISQVPLKAVQTALISVFKQWGQPQAIKVDNGRPFGDPGSDLVPVMALWLIGLGIDVVWRAARARIHYHLHKHDGRQSHFHAHSHVGDGIHKESRHNHEHIDKFPIRALFVGLIHGMAGSAALIILTLESVKSFWLGLAYIALFGIGSILGMAVLSTIISIPLNSCSKKLTWLHNSLQILIGVVTLGIGSAVLVRLY